VNLAVAAWGGGLLLNGGKLHRIAKKRLSGTETSVRGDPGGLKCPDYRQNIRNDVNQRIDLFATIENPVSITFFNTSRLSP
jgi:hypothetical protein